MFGGGDTSVFSSTRVRLWDRLEAYGAGVGTRMGRCKDGSGRVVGG